MTKEEIKTLSKGSLIFFAGYTYKFAEVKEFPHGVMIGIYDEHDTSHIDYLNPENCEIVNLCHNCQNGCPTCNGYGWYC